MYYMYYFSVHVLFSKSLVSTIMHSLYVVSFYCRTLQGRVLFLVPLCYTYTHTPLSLQTQPMDWDDGSHGSSEEDDFEEEEETPIAPVRVCHVRRVQNARFLP